MQHEYIIYSVAPYKAITWNKDIDSGIQRFRDVLKSEGKHTSSVHVQHIRRKS